jgi:hypothetical protein
MKDLVIDNIDVDVRLFNDEHFRRAPPPPLFDVFLPFPRLPAELRLDIWLLLLRRHRMIEVGLYPAEDEDATMYPGVHSDGAVKPRYYADRNSLGNIISSRGYTLQIECQGFATSLNPLLWVNSESRDITLNFYRVHMPFDKQQRTMLYLNPEYDVLCVRPEYIPRPYSVSAFDEPCHATMLADFLCDIRAYDPRGQGCVFTFSFPPSYPLYLGLTPFGNRLANIALDKYYPHIIFAEDENVLPVTPATLHPAAAAAFADILRNRLRSVFYITNFRDRMRGIPETPIASRMAYHFARTFPFRRRGLPVGGFDWLPTDPRPGVEFDLRQVALAGDPRHFVRCWQKMEKAFGITEPERVSHLYICPSLDWRDRGCMGRWRDPPVLAWSRVDLDRHLEDEANDWVSKRQFASKCFPGGLHIPKHGTMIDAKTFERLGSAPTTALGMWLIPAEAFKEPKNPAISLFDVSAVRPGLLLFDVGE